ncbi:MAG: ABC transporter substrate-binding protein [Clostridium sp.]|uniref:ABC transporter substrate-binding protein n=1 Tax=Clostridium sp. TaxID=1506 RepID=UPI003F334AE1
MKKIIKKLSLILSLVFFAIILTSCGKTNTETSKKEVRLNEVVRSVFYAPMYVAINEGYFDEEGISIDLSTGQGADKVMQNVLSKNADIGFCGPEQVIYIYNQGRSDYPVLFAQLTQKDGSFLVARDDKNFKWEDLKGKEVIGGRPGGVPQMSLEYVMRENNLNPKTDVNLLTNLDFTATASAFKAGTGDYVALFEPTASMLEKEGNAKIVASIGESAGNMPYTCFFSTNSYMKENPETIQGFTNAIKKGQDYFHSHSSKEIAENIQNFFPGTDMDILISVIDNYKEIDALAKDPTISEAELNHLMDIIKEYDKNLIQTTPPFNDIVNNTFANKSLAP